MPAVFSTRCSLQKVRGLPKGLFTTLPAAGISPKMPAGPNRDADPNGVTACVDYISGTGETSDFLKDSAEHLSARHDQPPQT